MMHPSPTVYVALLRTRAKARAHSSAQTTAQATPSLVLKSLATAQRERAEGLSGKRQLEFVIGRALLGQLIGKYAPNAKVVERSNAGPQVIYKDQVLLSSISHSHGVVVVTLSIPGNTSQKLGIDVEKARSDWRLEKTEFFCAPAELEAGWSLESEEARADFFTQLWSRKEAYFKARSMPILNRKLNKQPLLNHPNLRGAKIHFDASSSEENSDDQDAYFVSLYCDQDAKLVNYQFAIEEHGQLIELPNFVSFDTALTL